MQIKCQICNSEETIRSFAMHLRWHHPTIKTEDYVKQYGEFRPKKIQINEKKQESFLKCEICQEKMMHNQQLMYHITKKHKEVKKEEYIVKYFCGGVHPLCKCGCGEKVTLLPHGKTETGKNQYHVDYVKGHWEWIKTGYHIHSEITRDLMSKIAKVRIENEKKEKGFANMHDPKVLKRRREERKKNSINKLEEKYNVKILNFEEILTVVSCKEFKCKCNKCNNLWKQKSYNLRCIICNPYEYNNVSKKELELLDFIKDIYHKPIITNDYSILTDKEIDIYIPENKIGIEYNGLYWHSDLFKDSKYHYEKFLNSKNKNIHLIQIFEDEWLNKKEIVKSRLKNILGISENKIYARKCYIKEIDVKVKNKFLNENHIQGEDKSKIKLGLFFEDKLISVMTFGNPRLAIGKKLNTQENEWELVRYCSILNTNIIGGASKLFQYFIKNYKPIKIYSFADNRWSNNKNSIYSKLGFNLIKVSSPGYWYTKNFVERHHRYNFRKQRLKELGYNIENKTEWEIMEELKYVKIWDCGVSRYEYIVK